MADLPLIAAIKAEGIRKELFDRCRQSLYGAQRASEEAAKDSFKKFTLELAKARAFLDEADLIHAELQKCSSESESAL
jgi:hypothetical protein